MEGVAIRWMSTNTTVGTVSPATATTGADGTATTTFSAIAEGTTTVRGGTPAVYDEASVTVEEVPELTTISVEPETADLNVTETQQFTATAYDQDGDTMAGVVITWTSTDPSVGTVSPATATTAADGTATTTFEALANGTTTIIANNGTVYDTASVTVVPVVIVLTTISVDPETANLTVNATKQFTATAYDQYEEVMPDVVFTWGCLNETVGTIDDTGLFTALAKGTTIVGAYNASVGLSILGTATVNVTDWSPWIYDADGDGIIDYDEAVDAVQDYFDDIITKDQAILVIALYFG